MQMFDIVKIHAYTFICSMFMKLESILPKNYKIRILCSKAFGSYTEKILYVLDNYQKITKKNEEIVVYYIR